MSFERMIDNQLLNKTVVNMYNLLAFIYSLTIVLSSP